MPYHSSMQHGCCCEALPSLSVCSKVIVLVPAMARLFVPECIWPARVHGMLLGTKTEVIGPGTPAVLDLKPRSRLGK